MLLTIVVVVSREKRPYGSMALANFGFLRVVHVLFAWRRAADHMRIAFRALFIVLRAGVLCCSGSCPVCLCFLAVSV